MLVGLPDLREIRTVTSVRFHYDCVGPPYRQEVLDILWDRNFQIFVDTFQPANQLGGAVILLRLTENK
jgi:hypothetical protein